MDFDHTWFSSTTPAELRALAVDADSRRATLAAAESPDVRVSSAPLRQATIVRITRTVRTGARGPAAVVIGRFLAMLQTERWSAPDPAGAVTATVDITFPHRPMTVVARIEITPVATGCHHRIVGRVDAHLPGIGPLVEKRILDQMLSELDRELAPAAVEQRNAS